MNFVNALPMGKIRVGSVFYADGFGYAVVVMMTGTQMAKAYTAYKRPLILLGNSDAQEFKVYPQLANKADDSSVADSVKSELGPVCERVEFTETDKVLSMDIEENWEELLGKNSSKKLTTMLVDGLVTSLHTSQLAREERKWADAVVAFRTNQKPLRVDGKMFKPKASRFICGFEQDGVRNLFFVKKITNVIYRAAQDITKADAPYVVTECDENALRGELQQAVRDHLVPMAAYDYLFGKSSDRTVQVSGQIPVELQERMKWGGYSLPQVIQAGIQALEDEEYAREYKDVAELPNVIKGRITDSPERRFFRALFLKEEF